MKESIPYFLKQAPIKCLFKILNKRKGTYWKKGA